MDYREKYEKIVDGLVKKSFPSLKKDKIFILDYIRFVGFIAQASDFGFFKLLFINSKKIKELSNKELVGLFAHELGHFERYKKRIFLQKIIFIFSSIFSKKVRSKEEKDTDILIIRKGYGGELLKIGLRREKKYSKQKLNKVYSAGFLSPKEIKFYMKKFKK